MNRDRIIAYTIFRVTMGLNFLFHAINRYYYGTESFQNWMVGAFEETFFPVWSVEVFAMILPVLEGIAGLLMLIGLKTRWGYYLGASIIGLLVVGSCMINKWDWVAFQMVYAICFFALVFKVEHNKFSLDQLISKST